MKVGLGRSGSCSVCRRTPRPKQLALRPQAHRRVDASASPAGSPSAATSVKRDQHPRSVCSGWRSDRRRATSAAGSASCPSPVIAVKGRLIASPPCAVGDDLDVGVGVGVDARGDRDRAAEVALVVGRGDRLDRLRVGADHVAEPVGEPRQGAAVACSWRAAGWCRARRRRRPRRAPSACAAACAARSRSARW